MPTKAKPSDWQPVDLDYIRRAQKEYSLSALSQALKIAEPLKDQARNKLRKDILEIVGLLAADLHFQTRPKESEKKAALQKLLKSLLFARRTLKNLDADSRKLVEKAAELEGRPHISANDSSDYRQRLSQLPESEKKVGFAWVPPPKEEEFRFAEAERSLNLLCMWSYKAYRASKNTPLGAPQKNALREAVIRLARAWQRAKDKAPTRRNKLESVWSSGEGPHQTLEYGPFRKFANAIVRPFELSVSDSMAKNAIEVLKKEKSGTNRPT